jgi:hypothetical protein
MHRLINTKCPHPWECSVFNFGDCEIKKNTSRWPALTIGQPGLAGNGGIGISVIHLDRWLMLMQFEAGCLYLFLVLFVVVWSQVTYRLTSCSFHFPAFSLLTMSHDSRPCDSS